MHKSKTKETNKSERKNTNKVMVKRMKLLYMQTLVACHTWQCTWGVKCPNDSVSLSHGVRTHQHAFHFSASILPYLAARCVRTAARLTSGAMALTLSVTDGTHKHVASPHKMFRRPLLCLRFTPVLPSACKNHFTKSYYTVPRHKTVLQYSRVTPRRLCLYSYFHR
jgi:hypothetical protein